MRHAKTLERLRNRLLRRGLPRFQMTVIVTVTAVAAFLFSFLLLRAGVTSMALRYPLAATLAYLLFLAQLRIWLAAVRRRAERSVDVDAFELVEAIEFPSRQPAQPPRAVRSPPDDPPLEYETVPTDTRTSSGPDIDIPGHDLDEGIVLLVPLALVLGGSLAALYVIYSAPILFAELILDGVIVASLYRRFKHLTPEGWLPIAVRRTRMPFVALVLILGAVGLAATYLAPGADSIGDLFRSPDAR